MRIKVYTYCSYKFSPVGFRHAYFSLNIPGKEPQGSVIPESIGQDYVSMFIRDCFIEGALQQAAGKVPDTDDYVIILKGLECSFENEDNMPSKIYGNFAFRCESQSDYQMLSALCDSDNKAKFAQNMVLFLKPDSDSELTAFQVDADAFRDCLTQIIETWKKADVPEQFLIHTVSQSAGARQTLENRFPDFCVERCNDGFLVKKKHSILNLPIWALTAGTIALVLVIVLLIGLAI